MSGSAERVFDVLADLRHWPAWDPLTTRSTFAIMDGAAGATVIVRHEQHLRGLRRLLEPFVRPSVRRDLAERMLAFRRVCDAQA